MKKKVEKQEKENKTVSITGIIRDNYAWFIAIITFFGVIFLNVLRFIEYISCVLYFDYFGLDINFYKYHDQNFLYNLCLTIIFSFAFCAILFCFKQLCDSIKDKKLFCKKNFWNVCLVLFFNFYFLSSYLVNSNYFSMIISFCLLLFLEFFLSCLLFKVDSKSDDDNLNIKEYVIEILKKVPFVIILFITAISLSCFCDLKLKNEYRIIDDNKVIVYSNVDYFLTLDCTVKDDKLVIFKGTQQKISSTDVYSKLIEFRKVEIK